MSHVRSRRRGRLNDEDIHSESEEGSVSNTDHSSDDLDSSEDDVDGSSSDEEERSEDEQESGESESETESTIQDLESNNPQESLVTTIKTQKETTTNTTIEKEKASPTNIKYEAKEQETTSISNETSNETSTHTSPAQLTDREKQILERREYRRKLAEDPSFVPYVGMFWSHDDRYREDALRPALDNGPPPTPDTSEKRKFMRRNSNKPDYNADQSQQQHANKNYRRVPDNLINSKWNHDGYDWLLRMDEQDEQRKRDGLSSQSSKQPFRRHHQHSNRQRRQRRLSVSNDANGANSRWQSFDPKQIEADEKETWQQLNKDKDIKKEEKMVDSWGNNDNANGPVVNNANDDGTGGWGDVISKNDQPTQSQIGVSTEIDDWASTQANMDWKSYSLPTTDSWDSSKDSMAITSKEKDDKKKATHKASTMQQNVKEKEKGITKKDTTDGWDSITTTDNVLDPQLEAASAGWTSFNELVKTEGWTTTTFSSNKYTGSPPSPSIAKQKENEWGFTTDIKSDNKRDNPAAKETKTTEDGWGSSLDGPKVEGWSDTTVPPSNGWDVGFAAKTEVEDGWKNNADWNTSEVATTPKKQPFIDSTKNEFASTAWGSWDKQNNNSKQIDQSHQQQQSTQRRGRGYLSQKKPPTAPPAQQQQNLTPAPHKSIPATKKDSKSTKKEFVKKEKFVQQEQPSFMPAYDFDSFQNTSLGNDGLSRGGDTWDHEKFNEDKEDQESDVEIILEADDGLSMNWGKNDISASAPVFIPPASLTLSPPPVPKKDTQDQHDKSTTKRRSHDNSSNSRQPPSQPRRMDDNWRRKDGFEQPASTAFEDANNSITDSSYIPEISPNPYYYQQPMGTYVPLTTALPQTYGMPLQPTMGMPATSSAPTNDANNATSNINPTDGSQQYMSAYEANGMVYYGMDPNMYQYYYYPPQATMPPMSMMAQQQHNGRMIVVDDVANAEEDDGWGAPPPFEEEWQVDNSNTHDNSQRQSSSRNSHQHQQQAFYYYPPNSSQYYT